MATKLPKLIETERLNIELYSALQIKHILPGVIEANLDYLAEWMPWATPEAFAATDYSKKAVEWKALEDAGSDFHYGIWVKGEDDELVGAIGAHHRNGQPPETIEIGYWLTEAAQGSGYMTEAVRALTNVAFTNDHIATVEITYDETNAKSSAICERLGFARVGTRFSHHGTEVVVTSRSTPI